MKIVAFQLGPGHVADGAYRHGLLLPDGRVLDLDHPASGLPTRTGPHSWLDTDGEPHQAARALHGDLVAEPERVELLAAEGAVHEAGAVCRIAPVPRPGKFVCIGLNYKDHAEESGMAIPTHPLVFSKWSSCTVGDGARVVLPPGAREVDYEAEFGVVIGKRASRVSLEDAMDHVLGYTCINDVSARDFQFADGQWQRGKSCETFGPMGPAIVTRDEVADPHALRIQLRLNGQTLQDSSTDQLIFDVPQLVHLLSQAYALEPGDVISTGTPPGVGFARKPPVYLKPGDVMEVEIEGLGVLTNPVVGPDGEA